MNRHLLPFSILPSIASLLLATSFQLHAQTYQFDPTQSAGGPSDGSAAWDNGTTTDWYNGTGIVVWNNNGTINAAIGVANAGTSGSPDTITLADGTTINVAGITFNDVTPYTNGAGQSTGYIIAPGDSGSTLNLEGLDGSITDNTAATTVSVISANITGQVGLLLTGTGILALTGNDTYTGNTTISSGTLQIGDGGAAGNVIGSISDTTALNFDRSDSFLFANTISGGGSVSQIGSGTLILTGSDNYTGGTTISSGTLQVGNGGLAGAITGNVTDNSSLVFDLSGPVSFSGSITGSGSLTQEGSSSLILTGTDSFSGGTTISSGTLQIGSGSTTGTLTGNVLDNGALIFNNTGTVTFGGTISGSGTLSEEGTGGTLILSVSNSYQGGTSVSGGTLQLGSTTSLGATTSGLTVTGGTVDLHGNSITIGALNGSGLTTSILSNSSDATLTVDGGGAYSGTLVDGSGGTLALDVNGGTLVLTGVNTYTGGTTITSGTLQIGTSTTGSIITTGTISDNGTLAFDNSGTVTVSGAITGSGALTQMGTGTLILTNTNSYAGLTTISAGTLQIGNGTTAGTIVTTGPLTDNGILVIDHSDAVTFSGNISGKGAVTTNGTGLLTLSGANSYTGGTTISNTGGAQAGSTTAFGAASSNLTIDGGGTVDLHGFSQTIGALNNNSSLGSGTLLTNTGSATLTVTNGGAYAGVLEDGSGGGVLSLVLTGGTLMLSGNDSYTGGTTLNGGTLELGSATALGASTNNLAFGGGSLDLNGNSVTVNTLNGAVGNIANGPSGVTIPSPANATLTVTNGGVFSGTIGDGNPVETLALTQSGGTLILTGENTYSGGTTISSGTLQIGAGGATGSLAVNGAIVDNGALIFDNTSTVANTIDGIISGSGTLTQEGAGSTLILGGANSYLGGTLVTAGTLQLGSSSALGNTANNLTVNGGGIDLNGNNLTVSTLNGSGGTFVSNGGAGTLTVTDGGIYSGILEDGTGTLALTESGGTLVLTGANTYSGGTTISGTLQIGNGGSTGSLLSSGAVTDNGSLVFDNTSDTTISGIISGSGSVTQKSTGTLNLTGADTYGGGTIISGGGTIDLGANTGSLENTSALTFNHAGGEFDYDNTGSSGSKSQGIGVLTFNSGNGIVVSTLGSANSATLTFSSLGTRAAGAVGNFVTTGGTNGSTNSIVITGQATGFISPGMFFDGGTGSATYAYYDSGHFVRGITYGADANSISAGVGATVTFNDSGANTSINSSGNVETTGAISAQTSAQFATLQISGAYNFTQTSTSILTVDGILKTGGNAATISGGSLTTGGATDLVLSANASGDVLTISESISSTTTGGITITGAGMVVLNSANSYAGATTVDSGTLKLGNADALGSGNALVLNGGTLDLNGNSLSIATLNGTAGSLTDSGAASTLTVASGGTYTGSLSGALGLTSTSGTLILDGAETYSGNTTITAGTLQIGNGDSLGSLNTVGNIADGGALVFDSTSNSTIGGNITGSGTVTQEGPGSTVVLTGTNSYGGATTISAGTLQIGNGGATGSLGTTANVTDNGALVFDTTSTITIDGQISGSGTLTEEGTGGTLILNGANSFTGGTTLSAGTLQVGNASALGGSPAIVTVNGGTLDVNGYALNLTILNGSGGTVTNNGAATTLTVGSTDDIGVYAGAITNGIGALSFDQLGGVQTLSGTNTYTGGTTVGGGVLVVDGSGSLAGTVSIANNASLDINGGGTYANTISLTGSGVDGNAFEGAIGGLDLTGALYLTASNATVDMTGPITLNGLSQFTENASGTQVWNFTGGIGGTGGLILGGAGTGSVTFGLGGNNTFTGGITLALQNVLTGHTGQSETIELLSSTAIPTGSAFNLNSSPGLVAALDLNGFNATFTSLGGTEGGTAQIINSSATAATLTVANAGTDTFNGNIGATSANNLGLTLTGNTDLILAGANSYSGTTMIASTSTLQIGTGTATGSAGSGPISDSGALIFDVAAPLTIADLISGGGTLTQEGGVGQTLTLTAADTYSGATVIRGGNIDLQANTASLNGSTGTALTFGTFSGAAGGLFNYDTTGSSGAKSQGMGTLTFGGGEDTVESTLSGASSATLTFSSLAARAAGATGNFVTTGGANGSINTIAITGQATGFIDQGTFFDGGTASANYAYYDSGGFVRGIDYGVDPNSLLVSTTAATIGAVNATSPFTNVEVTAPITAQTTTKISTLQISGANNFTQVAGSTLTTAGILKSGGTAATISGGSLTSGGNTELVIRTDESGDILTISDPIASSSTGGLTKSGAGTLILTGSNAYTGGTTIDAGTLQIGNGGATGSIAGTGNVVDNAGATLAFDISAPTTVFNGSINGGGALLQEGAGTLILTSSNTFSGGTTISSGTLQIGTGNGGGLSASAAVLDNSSLVFDLGTFGSFGGIISGSGSVTQGSTGSLSLTGQEAYTGATIIDNGGTLNVLTSIGGINGTTGTALTFSGAGGTFNENNSGAAAPEGQNMGALTFSSGDGVVQSTFGNAGDVETVTFSSLAARTAGATGNFVTTGGANGSTNSIVITGQATGFIDQGTFFDGGTTSANYAYYDSGDFVRGINYGYDPNSFSAGAGATITSNLSGANTTLSGTTANVETTGAISAQTSAQFATLQISGAYNFTQTSTSIVTTSGILKTGGNSATISGGSLTSGGPTELVIRADESLDVLTISDSITSSSTGGLTKSGLGTLVLSGANAYIGTTTNDGGTLQIGNTSALGATTNGLTVNGGTVDLHGFAITTGLLNGAGGTIADNLAATGTTLTIGASGGTGTYAGVIANGTGDLAVTLSDGTQILTGANTYTGGTTITAGTLQIGNGGITGSLSATGSIADGGALVFDNVNPLASSTLGGLISGNGSLTQEGSGNTLILTDIDTYSGATTVGAGSTLQLGNGLTTGPAGNLPDTSSVTDNGNLVFDNTGAGTTTTTLTAALSGSGNLAQEGNLNTLVLTGNDAYSGSTTVATGSTLQIGNGGTTGTISGTDNVVDNGALVFDNTSATPETVGGAISGAGSLTQEGAGNTLILTGVNTYTGATTVSAGTLQLGNGGTTGNLNATGGVTDNGALVFDNTSTTAITVAGVISGSGSLTQEGAGNTLILTGNDTYTGSTAITAGTLQLGNGGVTGLINAAGNITDNGALVFDVSSTGTPYSGNITGSGSVTQMGSGTISLTGADTYGGGTTITAGTLQIGVGGPGGSITGDVTDNGTLAFDTSIANTFAGAITGDGTVTQEGSNALTLTGDSSAFTGIYAITSSSLIASGADVLGTTSSVVLSSNSTFDMSGAGSSQTIGSLASSSNSDFGESVLLGANTLTTGNASSTTYDGTIGGSDGSLVKQGAGALTLTGSSTYGGGTTVQSGTLLVENTAGSGTGLGNVLVESGAILGGNGVIAPTAGNGLTVASGGNLTSGVAPATGTIATPGLTLTNASGSAAPIVTFSAPVTPSLTTPQLTFYLGSGTATTAGLTLAGTSSFIDIKGNTANEVAFNNNIIQVDDLTSGSLAYGDYLLFQASSSTDYANLDTNGLGQIVSGLSVASNGAFAANYSSTLNLSNGDIYLDVEAIPEPGTWSLIFGGFFVLALQFYRRRSEKI